MVSGSKGHMIIYNLLSCDEKLNFKNATDSLVKYHAQIDPFCDFALFYATRVQIWAVFNPKNSAGSSIYHFIFTRT